MSQTPTKNSLNITDCKYENQCALKCGVGAPDVCRCRAEAVAGRLADQYAGSEYLKASAPVPINEGVKFDHGKPDFSLLSPIALARLSQVLSVGAKKYAAHNWRNGMNESRLLAAALRHIFAYLNGDDYDQETGLPHTAHAMCCLMFLIELHEASDKHDNRYKQNELVINRLRAILSGEVPPSMAGKVPISGEETLRREQQQVVPPSTAKW